MATHLDVHLWSDTPLHPDAQVVLGLYQALPFRYHGRHLYLNSQASYLLVFLGRTWSLCKCETISISPEWLERCRQDVRAEYEPFTMDRTFWHGQTNRFLRLQAPAGHQFFFPSSQSFEPILAEFAADVRVIQERLNLHAHKARPRETDFFMADISMRLGFFDRAPMNLWTLGTYFYHSSFLPERSPCWGGGYLPQHCCPRVSGERLQWCFGSDVDLDTVENCCRRYRELPSGTVAPLATPRRPQISVHIFLQSFHEDAFALHSFLDSVERFWPKKWSSRVFVAVDDSPADTRMCSELLGRATCIQTASIPRRSVRMDAIEWSGRNASARYRRDLLQYHYWLADVYISQHVAMPDWIAWFDADVVLHTPLVEELLLPFGRPVYFASRAVVSSMESLVLGLDWVGEFMDSFPQLVRPTQLGHLREFVIQTFQKADFEDAYQAWRQAVEDAALVYGKYYGYLSEGEGPQTSLPTFLYHFYHDDFTWALEDGYNYGLPLEDTCLAFRVASHMSAWKHRVRHGNWTPDSYRRHANRLMQLGARRAGALHVALLSSGFRLPTWSQSRSGHCLGRDRHSMLTEFFKRREVEPR